VKRKTRKQTPGQETLRGEREPPANSEAALDNAVRTIESESVRNFNLAMKKYAGSRRGSLLAMGYKSVDEFINDIRGRNASGELDVPGPFDSG
jgi:hypothetical protein